MSDIKNTVESLEIKINKVLNQFEGLKKENQDLKDQLKKSLSQFKSEQEQVAHWKSQFDTLKIANTMLGSDDNKRDTKLKINALIRDIDHCIGQLSE